MNQDERLIERCFELARKSIGKTSPNPLVGSVITKNGDIISEGFHKQSGCDHAELDAIKNSETDLSDTTLYCNLEPCVHTNKKTPPCAQRIATERIKKVVISNLDPNPLVAGNGVQYLRSQGIKVVIDIKKKEGEKLNEIFFHHIVNKTPFIHLKWAQTLDGFTATHSDHSKWISSEKSRLRVHKQRLAYDAIAIGSQTLRADNPTLNVRLDETSFKKRLIFSNSLSTNDLASQVFSDEASELTQLICQETNSIWNNQINYHSYSDLLTKLYDSGVSSLYVEGGSRLHSYFFDNGFQKASIFMTSKLIGGGKMALNTPIQETIPLQSQLRIDEVEQIDQDMLITAYPR